MIESRFVARKNELENELRLLNMREKVGVKDPRKRNYLLASILQLERGIQALGLSKEEIETNNVRAGHDLDKNVAVGKRHLIAPQWTGTEKKS